MGYVDQLKGHFNTASFFLFREIGAIMTRQDTKGDGKENAGTDINITIKQQNRPHLNKHLNLPRLLILTRLRDRTEILISFCLKIVTTCDFLNALAEQVVLAIIIAVLASSPGLVGQIGIGQRWGNSCQLLTSLF